MGNDAAYNAAKGAYSMYGAVLKDVAQEMGTDKAVDLHARQGPCFGAMMAEMIEDEVGDGAFSMQAVASALNNMAEGAGLIYEVESTETSATLDTYKCPIYDGLAMSGWNHDDIGRMCSCIADAEAAELKKTYPQITACLKFRSDPEASCVEEFLLEQ